MKEMRFNYAISEPRKYTRKKKTNNDNEPLFIFDYDWHKWKLPSILSFGWNKYEVLKEEEYIQWHARVELKKM